MLAVVFVLLGALCLAAGSEPNEKACKPAGQAADLRSAGSLTALRELADKNFIGLSSSWVGMLMQESMVFREKSSAKVYCSLGHVGQSLWLWEMTTVAEPSLQIEPVQLRSVALICLIQFKNISRPAQGWLLGSVP